MATEVEYFYLFSNGNNLNKSCKINTSVKISSSDPMTEREEYNRMPRKSIRENREALNICSIPISSDS